jgi:uncharacterized protein (DUF305 family)
MTGRYAFLMIAAITAFAAPAVGQQSDHGEGAATTMSSSDLPEACRKAVEAGGHSSMMHGSGMQDMQGMMGSMSEAHKGLMQAMTKMHPAMMTGMMAGDADVAWVCSMIPHHQGAIDMSRALLRTGGDNAQAKELAEETIQSQEREIAKLKQWLERHAEKEGNN